VSYLQLQGLAKSYRDVLAVAGLDLDIAQGELIALLGPSGCGKTTTLRMVAGFLAPSSGSIRVGGRDITQLPPWKRDMGLVFQSYALFPHMTVADNVAFGLRMRRCDASTLARRVAEVLRLVRLEALAQRMPRELSGGQQQRVALARALVIEPQVLLLDEPLSNLDAKLRAEVGEEIRELQRKLGLTTIMVTHDQDEALAMGDRLVVMHNGRVQQVGTQRELYEQPLNRFVAGFLGRTNFLAGKVEAPGLFLSHSGLRLHFAAAARSGQTLALRPELLSLVDQPTGTADNAVPGTVESVSYLGSQIDYAVRIADRERWLVQVPNHQAGEILAPGARVCVEWPARASLVLQDGGEAA
jgi:putative spermidine/putrescine transport system ATP-binding protein